jgi:hypothetical protein
VSNPSVSDSQEDAPLAQHGGDLDEMAQGPAKSIEPPHHERIAGLERGEGFGEHGARGVGARRLSNAPDKARNARSRWLRRMRARSRSPAALNSPPQEIHRTSAGYRGAEGLRLVRPGNTGRHVHPGERSRDVRKRT